MFDQAWKTPVYATLLIIWALSLLVRLIPSVRQRYPRLQRWSLAFGWLALLGIILTIYML